MRQPLPISQLTLPIGRWPNLILGDVKNSEYYSWKYKKIEIKLHNFVYTVVYSQARTDVPSGLLILFFTLLSTNKTMNCLYFKNIYKKTCTTIPLFAFEIWICRICRGHFHKSRISPLLLNFSARKSS